VLGWEKSKDSICPEEALSSSRGGRNLLANLSKYKKKKRKAARLCGPDHSKKEEGENSIVHGTEIVAKIHWGERGWGDGCVLPEKEGPQNRRREGEEMQAAQRREKPVPHHQGNQVESPGKENRRGIHLRRIGGRGGKIDHPVKRGRMDFPF